MQTEQTSVTYQGNQRKGRAVFLMMLTFFVVPIIAVVLMFEYDFKPTGTSRGELMVPPRLIETTATLKNSDGHDSSRFWSERWTMIYLAEVCEANCMAKLRDMRQIHVSMYKDIPRTQRVLVTTVQDVAAIKKDFPDLNIINQPTADINALSKQFNVADEVAMQSNRLYFVDPLGHIMMSYPSSTEAADIRKDLARLLRYSWAA
jgi:hypothetical protein